MRGDVMWLSLAWIWMKKYWWVVVAGIVVVVVAVMRTVLNQPVSVSAPVLENVRNKIRDIDNEAQLKKVYAHAKSDADREEVGRIEKIEDGNERRKALADMLTRLDAG